MNTQLKNVLVETEGRYPSASELENVKKWALAMPDRIEVAQRLAEKEEDVMTNAISALGAKHPEFGQAAQYPQERFHADLRRHLRYVAQSQVLDDPTYFAEQYAEWTAEMLCAVESPEVLTEAFEILTEAVKGALDAADFRALEPFFFQFDRCLHEA